MEPRGHEPAGTCSEQAVCRLGSCSGTTLIIARCSQRPKIRICCTRTFLGRQLLDLLIDDNGIEVFDDAGRDLVKKMIFGAKANGGGGHGHDDEGDGKAGSKGHASSGGLFRRDAGAASSHGLDATNLPTRGVAWAEERPFLLQLVANGVTGIDTDKFDYLARDTHNLGLSSAFDHKRLLYR